MSSGAWVQIPPLPNLQKVISTSQAKHDQETHGFEPWTYRTAADCSTTELYPPVIQQHSLFGTFLLRLADETFAKYAVTRIRTWVTAATTQGPNH